MARIVDNLVHQTSERGLPLEILKAIFEAPQLSSSDILQIMAVNKRWYLQAKYVLYQHIIVDKDFNIPLFLHCVDGYNHGRFVKTLSISHKSKNARRPPFTVPDHSTLLVLNCQNIVVIRMTTMDPFYMLKCLIDFILPSLEKIDICWETCRSSPSLQRYFYSANYNHKASIKYIDMPGRPKGKLHFIFETIRMDLLEIQFFEAFDKLERDTFQK